MQKPAAEDLVAYILAPFLFLTVALLGGIRVGIADHQIQFLPPTLVTCLLGLFVLISLARGGVIQADDHLGLGSGLLGGFSGILRIIAVYAATVQVLNLVTPEHGFFSFMFNLFFAMIVLNNLFVSFNPRRLAGAISAVLGVSFVVKYIVFQGIYAPGDSWTKSVLQEVLDTATVGVLRYQPFAPVTGYVAMLTIVLYMVGLYVISPRFDLVEAAVYKVFIDSSRQRREERRLLGSVGIPARPTGELLKAAQKEEVVAKGMASDRY